MCVCARSRERMHACVRVCGCVRGRARACVCVCVCVASVYTSPATHTVLNGKKLTHIIADRYPLVQWTVCCCKNKQRARVDQSQKDVARTKQQRTESPAVPLTAVRGNTKVHELHQSTSSRSAASRYKTQMCSGALKIIVCMFHVLDCLLNGYFVGWGR